MFEPDDDGLDFLEEPAGEETALRAALEHHRPAIVAWSAAAGVARSPRPLRQGGQRGRLLWQQEMNLHLIRVHEATVKGGAETLHIYAQWARRRLRGQDREPGELERTVGLLLEGLTRHLHCQHARSLVGSLAEAFDVQVPPDLADYLDLPPHETDGRGLQLG